MKGRLSAWCDTCKKRKVHIYDEEHDCHMCVSCGSLKPTLDAMADHEGYEEGLAERRAEEGWLRRAERDDSQFE